MQWVEADLFDFRAERTFDAIILVATLHHLDPLGDALSRLRSLLAEGGLLIIDDFDLEAPDDSTCRWYYDAQQRLAAAGLFSGDRIKTDRDLSPLTRWRLDHEHEHKLHSGAEMEAALAEQFDLRYVERGPYLYRYVCAGLPEDEIGARVAEEIFQRESDAVAKGELLPVGLRFVAQNTRPGHDHEVGPGCSWGRQLPEGRSGASAVPGLVDRSLQRETVRHLLE